MLYSLRSSDKMLGVAAAQEPESQEDYKDCDGVGDDITPKCCSLASAILVHILKYKIVDPSLKTVRERTLICRAPHP